jgi:hypothetical protein
VLRILDYVAPLADMKPGRSHAVIFPGKSPLCPRMHFRDNSVANGDV